MFDYKVSYRKEWNKEGTTYTQTITIFIPDKETLTEINYNIWYYKKYCKTHDDAKMYLNGIKMGKNYTTLTTADYMIKNYLNPKDKRIKRDRNTIINVKIKK